MNKLKIAPICFIILFSFIPNLLVNKLTNNHCTIKKNFDKKYQILDNGYWLLVACCLLLGAWSQVLGPGYRVVALGN